mmetsp:Transcript_2915/g.5409  ORF Transcript_2915/g.5409 Transcript_2915/m.5409 type:complete len:230 (-) Transcript_2915:170-859(-)
MFEEEPLRIILGIHNNHGCAGREHDLPRLEPKGVGIRRHLPRKSVHVLERQGRVRVLGAGLLRVEVAGLVDGRAALGVPDDGVRGGGAVEVELVELSGFFLLDSGDAREGRVELITVEAGDGRSAAALGRLRADAVRVVDLRLRPDAADLTLALIAGDELSPVIALHLKLHPHLGHGLLHLREGRLALLELAYEAGVDELGNRSDRFVGDNCGAGGGSGAHSSVDVLLA